MIDFVLGALVASAIWWFAPQLTRSNTPGAPGLPAALIARMETLMSQIADTINSAIDAKVQELVAAATATEAAKAADLKTQLDTATADLAAVQAHVDSLTAPAA